MKLLFWKRKRTADDSGNGSTAIKSKEEYLREYLRGGPIVNKSSDNGENSASESENQLREKVIPLNEQEDQHIAKEIEQALEDPRRYKVLSIKNWCEEKLTPVAYARVLVRILPVIREYSYNFKDLQHPTEDTRIKHDFYLIMRATIKEIYQEEYNKLKPENS